MLLLATLRQRRAQESNLLTLRSPAFQAGAFPSSPPDISTARRCCPCPRHFVRVLSTLVDLGGVTSAAGFEPAWPYGQPG